jgi:hypothetical protein
MLTNVTDQQHPIIRRNTGKEIPHLIGAGEARFIDEEEAAALTLYFFRRYTLSAWIAPATAIILLVDKIAMIGW